MKYEKQILTQQKNEITEHFIYEKLSSLCKDKKNKNILEDISKDELKHYHILKTITKKEVKPNKIKIWYYPFLTKIFGLTFALKLMESGEDNAQGFYDKISDKYPIAKTIEKDENEHEKKLISMLKDEKLKYAGAIVLGLNDALVELTGTLGGLSFAFASTTVIGSVGLVMGIAASLSMAASGYLSSKEDENEEENPIKSAIYTGLAYIITVAFLVVPYFIFTNVYYALALMLFFTILIIAAYTFYISVAKEVSFKKRFLEMSLISIGVAIISFGIGILVKKIFGIEI